MKNKSTNKALKLVFILSLYLLSTTNVSSQTETVAEVLQNRVWVGNLPNVEGLIKLFFTEIKTIEDKYNEFQMEVLGINNSLAFGFSALEFSKDKSAVISSIALGNGNQALFIVTGQLLNKNGSWIIEAYMIGNNSHNKSFSTTIDFIGAPITDDFVRSIKKESISKGSLTNYIELNTGNYLNFTDNTYSMKESNTEAIITYVSSERTNKTAVVGIYKSLEGESQSIGMFINSTDKYNKAIKSDVHPTTFDNRYSAIKISGQTYVSTTDEMSSNIDYSMHTIPFTDNGSSNWVSNVFYGEPGQKLKVNFDTGGSFMWVNSTQCDIPVCTDYGHNQFDFNKSSTFEWIDKKPQSIDWGPWGSSMANIGQDQVFLGGLNKIKDKFYLITSFDDTPQFQEFLWDGAIALPARTQSIPQEVSDFLTSLLNQGKLLPGKVAITFQFDKENNVGKVSITNNLDLSQVDESSKIVFPYATYSGVPYLWATELKSFKIGEKEFFDPSIRNFYSFDNGSSALKGDSVQMVNALAYADDNQYPDMTFEMGKDIKGNTGVLRLTQKEYVKKIEEGEGYGTKKAQIQVLSGTPGLYLQGSTMMENVFTVFHYNIDYDKEKGLTPFGTEVWMFNYKKGPQIIVKQ